MENKQRDRLRLNWKLNYSWSYPPCFNCADELQTIRDIYAKCDKSQCEEFKKWEVKCYQ